MPNQTFLSYCLIWNNISFYYIFYQTTKIKKIIVYSVTYNFRYFLIRKLVYELAKKKCYDARIRSCTCLGKHHRTASCSFVLFDSYACSVHECLICEVKWNLIILKTGIQFHITFASTFYINVTYASICMTYKNLY